MRAGGSERRSVAPEAHLGADAVRSVLGGLVVPGRAEVVGVVVRTARRRRPCSGARRLRYGQAHCCEDALHGGGLVHHADEARSPGRPSEDGLPRGVTPLCHASEESLETRGSYGAVTFTVA